MISEVKNQLGLYQAPESNPRKFYGKSSDVKPMDVPNGSAFFEFDTGNLYWFDAETSAWITN